MRTSGLWVSSLTLPFWLRESLCLNVIDGRLGRLPVYEKLWGCSYWIYSARVEDFRMLLKEVLALIREHPVEVESLFMRYSDEPWWRPGIMMSEGRRSIEAALDRMAGLDFAIWSSVDVAPASLIARINVSRYIDNSLSDVLLDRVYDRFEAVDFPISLEMLFNIIDVEANPTNQV